MSSDCPAFDLPNVRAEAAIFALFIVLFALTAGSWIVSQRRIPSPFKVVRWHSYGLTLLFWNLYVISELIVVCLSACYIIKAIRDSYGAILAERILLQLAMAFLLGTVLLPICRGLERLHGTQSGSKGWRITATILVTLFSLFTIIYLCLLIWQASSILNARGRSWRASILGAFPEHIYVYAALITLWFVLVLVGIAKMLLAINRAHVRVPSSLRIWVFVLAFGLFGLGFLHVFHIYYYSITVRPAYRQTVAENIAWQVMILLFSLVPVFAIREVARKLSVVLASSNFTGHKTGRGRGYDPENSPSGYSGSTH